MINDNIYKKEKIKIIKFMNSFRKELEKYVPIENEKSLNSKIYIFLEGDSSKDYFPSKIAKDFKILDDEEKKKPVINFVVETKEDLLSNLYFKAFSLDSLYKISHDFEVFESIEDLKSELTMRVAKGFYRLSLTLKGAEITFDKIINQEITLLLPPKKEAFSDQLFVIANKFSELQRKVNDQETIISKLENVKRNEKAFFKEKEELKAKNIELNKKIIEMSEELSKAKEEINFFTNEMKDVEKSQCSEDLLKDYQISSSSFSCFGTGNMVKKENIFKDFDEKLQEIMDRKHKMNNEFDIQTSLKELKDSLPKVFQGSFQDKIKEDLKLLEESFKNFAERVQIPQQTADFDKVKSTLNALIKKVKEISEANVLEKNKEIDLEKIKSNLDFLLSSQAKAVSDIKNAMNNKIKEQKIFVEKLSIDNGDSFYQEKIQDLEKFSQEIIEKISTTFEDFSKLASDIKTAIDDFSEKQCKASQIKDVSTGLEEMERRLESIEKKAEESEKGRVNVNEMREAFMNSIESYASDSKNAFETNRLNVAEVLAKIYSEIEKGEAAKEKSLEWVKKISENIRAMEEGWKKKESYIQSCSAKVKEMLEKAPLSKKVKDLASFQQMSQLEELLKNTVAGVESLVLKLESQKEKGKNLEKEYKIAQEKLKGKEFSENSKEMLNKMKDLKNDNEALRKENDEIKKIYSELKEKNRAEIKAKVDIIDKEEKRYKYFESNYVKYVKNVKAICTNIFRYLKEVHGYQPLIKLSSRENDDCLISNILGRINLTAKIGEAYRRRTSETAEIIEAKLLFSTDEDEDDKIKDYYDKCKKEKYLLFIWAEENGEKHKCFFTTIGDVIAKDEEEVVDECAFFTELCFATGDIKESDKKVIFYQNRGLKFWRYTIEDGFAIKVKKEEKRRITYFRVYSVHFFNKEHKPKKERGPIFKIENL